MVGHDALVPNDLDTRRRRRRIQDSRAPLPAPASRSGPTAAPAHPTCPGGPRPIPPPPRNLRQHHRRKGAAHHPPHLLKRLAPPQTPPPPRAPEPPSQASHILGSLAPHQTIRTHRPHREPEPRRSGQHVRTLPPLGHGRRTQPRQPPRHHRHIHRMPSRPRRSRWLKKIRRLITNPRPHNTIMPPSPTSHRLRHRRKNSNHLIMPPHPISAPRRPPTNARVHQPIVDHGNGHHP